MRDCSQTPLKLLSIIFTGLLLFGIMGGAVFVCQGVVIWSDDFSDRNYTEWTIFQGSFSAANQFLQGSVGSVWNWARHRSTIAYGTWSFDVYHSGAEACPYVWFVANDLVAALDNRPTNSYGVHISPYVGIELIREEDNIRTILDGYFPPEGVRGWWHYDITRDHSGNFYVYLNGTLRMEDQDLVFTASNYFFFECWSDHGLDNIVVSDTVDIDPPETDPPTDPPTPAPPPPIPGFPWLSILLALVTVITFTVWHHHKHTSKQTQSLESE
jgi:hypothetical protein